LATRTEEARPFERNGRVGKLLGLSIGKDKAVEGQNEWTQHGVVAERSKVEKAAKMLILRTELYVHI
jgi:hypothetical protein